MAYNKMYYSRPTEEFPKQKSHLLRRSITMFNPMKLEASDSEQGNEALGPVKMGGGGGFLDELGNFSS
jgi:hypothetical protein